MSILARNMKLIRKELNCTQGTLAEVLNVGFRTYVRYEAGERDAPVSVLVKMARLGNVSLENLLTQELKPHQISPHLTDRLDNAPPEIRSCNLKQGTVIFSKPAREALITLDSQERRLLAGFRKGSQAIQDAFIKSMGGAYKVAPSAKKMKTAPKRQDKQAARDHTRTLAQAAAIKPVSGSGKKRPGRKKLDRKSLKEKLDKLKSVTRSAPKTTVR